MDETVTIERATITDLEPLVALGCAFAAEHDTTPPDANRIRNGMTPLLEHDRHGIVLIARQGATLIGYAVICWSWSVEIGGFEVVLDEVYTTERNSGVGSLLIEAVDHECASRGVLRIFLETERRNERVRGLYLRHGYTEDDSIWMSKTL